MIDIVRDRHVLGIDEAERVKIARQLPYKLPLRFDYLLKLRRLK